MPLFRYQATDKQGRSVEGSVSADTVSDAQAKLLQRGLSSPAFNVGAANPGVVATPPPQVAQPRSNGVSPVAQAAAPGTNPAGSVRASAVGSVANPVVATAPRRPPSPGISSTQAAGKPVHHTKRGSYTSLNFLFSQIGAYVRSGTPINTALSNLASTQTRADYAASLRMAETETTNGRSMANAFDAYPDLYPPHASGLVRAGEAGGFLPEAAMAMSNQARESRRMQLWGKWIFWIVVSNVVLAIPFWVLARSLLSTLDVFDANGGQGSGIAVLLQQTWKQFLYPVLPLTLLILAPFVALSLWWASRPMRLARHKLVLYAPSLRNRAKSEAMQLFSFAMDRLSRAGLSPQAVWSYAAACVPNLVLRQKLEDVARGANETTKLSEMLAKSELVPIEYSHIVFNGEMMGDVPTALDQVSQAEAANFDLNDKGARARLGCWAVLIIVVSTLIAYGAFCSTYYTNLFHKFLDN